MYPALVRGLLDVLESRNLFQFRYDMLSVQPHWRRPEQTRCNIVVVSIAAALPSLHLRCRIVPRTQLDKVPPLLKTAEVESDGGVWERRFRIYITESDVNPQNSDHSLLSYSGPESTIRL